MGKGGSVYLLVVLRCAAVVGAAMTTVTTAMKLNAVTYVCIVIVGGQ